MKRRYGMAFVLLSLLPGALLVGCGGGSVPTLTQNAETKRASATMAIVWPESTTPPNPADTNSLKISFVQFDTVVASRIITRPARGNQVTLTFDNLPLGTLQVTAEAFSSTDASGTPQTSATVTTAIIEGQAVPVNLTLSALIDQLALSPANPTVPVGANTALTVTARNTATNTVFNNPSTLVWTSLTPTLARVDQSGTVTGLSPGTAQIQVKDTNSGTTATIAVIVVPS